MNKKLKKVLAILLALLSVVPMTGCFAFHTEARQILPMETEYVPRYSFDFIGGDDVMPIMGYFGPYGKPFSYNGNKLPDMFSDEMFQLYADTGINMISHNDNDYATYPSVVKQLLEQGEKYNIGIQVYDTRILDEAGAQMSLESLDALLNEYANYPAYCGNYIIDEPGQESYLLATLNGTTIADAAPIFQKFNELDVYGYGNLLPIISGKEDKYQAYIDEYIESCNPPYLQYDMYPFEGSATGHGFVERYFQNMSMIKASADANNIPFWGFVQIGSQYNDAGAHFDTNGYYPTKGQTYWNVGTLLAFGAKGINYFTLVQPYWFAYAQSEPFDFQRNGLIGAWGNKTRWYYYAQDINKQIAAVDEVLMNSVNKGIIATSNQIRSDLGQCQFLMDGTSWRELKNVTGEALIGCFNYQGKTALYVVNYDVEYAQKIQLEFLDEYKVTVIQDAERTTYTADEVELVLSAGNGALIVFE